MFRKNPSEKRFAPRKKGSLEKGGGTAEKIGGGRSRAPGGHHDVVEKKKGENQTKRAPNTEKTSGIGGSRPASDNKMQTSKRSDNPRKAKFKGGPNRAKQTESSAKRKDGKATGNAGRRNWGALAPKKRKRRSRREVATRPSGRRDWWGDNKVGGALRKAERKPHRVGKKNARRDAESGDWHTSR